MSRFHWYALAAIQLVLLLSAVGWVVVGAFLTGGYFCCRP